MESGYILSLSAKRENIALNCIRNLQAFNICLLYTSQADEADRKLKEKELKALLARDEELDGLFERIYEDLSLIHI